MDQHSLILINSNLELLLNYCDRFYTRQFLTRTSSNHDVLVKFKAFLEDYFASDKIREQGLPTVQGCAEAMNYSPNYLSDLLKKETGKTTLEHIHFQVIDVAKTRLLASTDSIKEISYHLGFDYPQVFSRFFKREAGMSPNEYRKAN